MMNLNPPVRMYVVSAKNGSPFGCVSNLQAKCACGKQISVNFAGAHTLLLSRAQLRELFEKSGTAIPIQTKDVMAGAALEELGDKVMGWCDSALVGESCDLPNHTSITRVKDDYTVDKITRIGWPEQQRPRLVGVG